MEKTILRAFSLVELMVTLIVISCLVAALAPVITKKLKSQGITIVGGDDDSGGGEVSTDCSGLFNEDCKLCNVNFCMQCEKVCTDGYYKNIARCNCLNCETYTPNCATCDSVGCLSCKSGFKFTDGLCKLNSIEQEYTSSGVYTFVVPEGVDELEVTLVSGGAGGGGGSTIAKTQSFVHSGNANITADANNTVTKNSTGRFTWTIPQALRGKIALVSACGGGGGGGGTFDNLESAPGGDGGAIKNAVFNVPDWDSIKIQIGGGGGGGGSGGYAQNGYPTPGKQGGCALGGSGGGLSSSLPCSSTGNYGKGGGASSTNLADGYDGYDPIYGNHGSGGGKGGSGGGDGSLLAGGGGGKGLLPGGGGGGGATLFYHAEYANVESLVAPGGGGGNVWPANGGGGGGGGGGGIGGGNGSSGGANSNLSIFGSNYCQGGESIPLPTGSEGDNGLNGAMRIFYYDTGTTGGSGGGSGHIVPMQKISVNSGEVLTITVGKGGNGGIAGHYDSSGNAYDSSSGEGASADMVSKITRANGSVLITSASNISSAGATGGNPNGTTVGAKGYITNGLNNSQITVSGYSNTNGEAANSTNGGNGGSTTLNNVSMHCSPGTGGTSGSAGSAATGYGGCGGGGGGAGAAGGAGAPGYVKIKYEG